MYSRDESALLSAVISQTHTSHVYENTGKYHIIYECIICLFIEFDEKDVVRALNCIRCAIRWQLMMLKWFKVQLYDLTLLTMCLSVDCWKILQNFDFLYFFPNANFVLQSNGNSEFEMHISLSIIHWKWIISQTRGCRGVWNSNFK